LFTIAQYLNIIRLTLARA